MNAKNKHIRLFLLFFLLCSHVAFAESFRVRGVVLKELDENSKTELIKLGMNHALYIQLPEQTEFLKSIELKITIPSILAEYGGGVAYSFYDNVSPTPSEKKIDYSAQRLHIGTFSNRLTYYIQIPISDDFEIKDDPYSTVVSLKAGEPLEELFFRIHIVMKGIPDGLFDSTLEVEIRPVLADKGVLDLSVLYPENMKGDKEEYPFILFINEIMTDFTNEPIALPVGTHHITISSEHFRNEVQTFIVEKASETHVEIQLQDIAPLLAISAPEHTRFFLNDVEYKDISKPIVVTPGMHQLRFSVGEYEILRTVEVLNGRTYNINVLFDIDISEQ